ncbi:MAG TPA: MauE/DoxX family redox-associated membrane protein [Acidobacteriota bacterium]|nr:MauE/DoxX family redox-associated membrane protein [Acidobacteriota bacterium]
MSILRNDWVCLVFRVALGALFIYASLDKIVNPEAFARIMNNYHLLPGSLVNINALFLPWLELLVGAALILGTKTEGASTIIAGLLVVFVIAAIISMARGLNIECGCFSTSSRVRKVGLALFFEDSAMLLAALYVMINGAGRWALDRRPARH